MEEHILVTVNGFRVKIKMSYHIKYENDKNGRNHIFSPLCLIKAVDNKRKGN